jgi:hypothetical protein
MSNKYQRSLVLRVLGSLSAFCLMLTLLYVVFAGISLYSSLIIVAAIGVLGGQAFSVAESALECVVAFFEILLEGVMAIFEMIGSIFHL